MAHGHFSHHGPYAYDERAAFYRQQDDERRQRELTDRAARWIASKMAGHQFDTLAALERAVIDLVTTMQDGEPDDAMRATITRACVALWMGEVTRDAMYRLCVVKSETGVTFTAA